MLCGKLVQNISLSLVYSLPPLRRARANILSKCVYIFTQYTTSLYTPYIIRYWAKVFSVKEVEGDGWVGGWSVGCVIQRTKLFVIFEIYVTQRTAAPRLLYCIQIIYLFVHKCGDVKYLIYDSATYPTLLHTHTHSFKSSPLFRSCVCSN